MNENFKVTNFVGRDKAEKLSVKIGEFYLHTLHEIRYEGILTDSEADEIGENLLKAFNNIKLGIKEFYNTIEHQCNTGNL